jgi:hypothetical protein
MNESNVPASLLNLVRADLEPVTPLSCAVAPLVSARTARAGPFLWAADVLGLARESRVAAKLDELGIVSARIARRCCADGTCVTTSRARPRRAQADGCG